LKEIREGGRGKKRKKVVDVTEQDLLEFEKRIVDYARKYWRVSDITYLQLLAQLQHYGAPTRLIDVSLNPYVAVWMAVERQGGVLDDEDGRLFAFVVSDGSISDARDNPLPMDRVLSTYECPWSFDTVKGSHGKSSESSGAKSKYSEIEARKWVRERWCTGTWFWRPSAYNERISAQYSGFLLGGVPNMYPSVQSYYRKEPGEGKERWSIKEVRESTSISLRLVGRKTALRSIESAARGRAVYAIRIDAKAKKEIRDNLERTFSVNSSTVYPDIPGLASEIKKALERKDSNLIGLHTI
jgi:FRG domain protein